MSLTENHWDPSIPPWKKELLLKKRSVISRLNMEKDGGRGLKEENEGGDGEKENGETVVDPAGMDYGGELHASHSKYKEWEIPRIKTGKRIKHVKYMESDKTHPPPPPSPAFSSYSDGFSYDKRHRTNEEEMEYGPGIVDRLRSKFINWSVKDEKNHHYNHNPHVVRRVASLEHLLKNDSFVDVVSNSSNKRQFPVKRKLIDNLKKARSMETLSNIDRGGFSSSKTLSHPEKLNSAAFVNENLVIIEQPKNNVNLLNSFLAVPPRKSSGICIEDDELPKPDTVRTFTQLFESDSKVKNPKKTTWKVKINENGVCDNKDVNSTSQKNDLVNNKINKFEKFEKKSNFSSSTSANEENFLTSPKIVSLKPKNEEKPIGFIRPLSVDKKENFKNKTKCENQSKTQIQNGDENSEKAIPQQFALKKRGAVSPENETNSLVFNFTGKNDVTPKIRNSESSFSVVRPVVRIDKISGKLVSNLITGENSSGIVLVPGCHSQDFSDEEDGGDGKMESLFPCGIVFEGENVCVGKTAFLERRNKQLKISFHDAAADVYEYPSETVMLEEYLKTNPPENNSEIEPTQPESVPLVNNTSLGILKPNPALSSNLGGLAGYVPSKHCDPVFELGVSRPTKPAPNSEQNTAVPIDDGTTTLKPADDDEAATWSHSQTVETDLLF